MNNTIEELNKELEATNEEYNRILQHKAEIEEKINLAKREKEKKLKEKKDNDYEALKIMVNSFNELYNENIVLAKKFEFKVGDSRRNDSIDSLIGAWRLGGLIDDEDRD